MGEELSYVDWEELVQVSENNIKICEGNIRKGKRGLMLEKIALNFATKERDKYPEPEPETMAEDEEEKTED